MKTLLNLIATLSLAATSVMGDTNIFKEIIGDAVKIQRDAELISSQLKSKQPDFESVKSRSDDLSRDIRSLQSDLDAFEAGNPGLTTQQKADWELVKIKAQLLVIFSDSKNGLLNTGDPQKNRSMLRAYSDGIAKRAALLQETAKKLNR